MACRILLVTDWPNMVISVSLIPSDRPLRAVRIKYSRPQKRRRELSAFPSARASMALCSTSGGRMLRKRERKMVPERAAVSAGRAVKEEAMISFRPEVGWSMGLPPFLAMTFMHLWVLESPEPAVVFIFRQQFFMGRCGDFSVLSYPQDLAGFREGAETVGNE